MGALKLYSRQGGTVPSLPKGGDAYASDLSHRKVYRDDYRPEDFREGKDTAR